MYIMYIIFWLLNQKTGLGSSKHRTSTRDLFVGSAGGGRSRKVGCLQPEHVGKTPHAFTWQPNTHTAKRDM